MDLSPEDSLRLNVLLANKPLAIRLDEARMSVHGLGPRGETQVQLTPTCREDRYIKRVKELISGHILGSPGGYPVYLQRWTRMGQMRDDSLEQMLLLGEPEAVVAAVCAPGLTDELARRAWWAMEDAENARSMLTKSAVVEGLMGPVLARYLVEHLPFETEAVKQIETVGLVLQAGLLDDVEVAGLWRKAQRKPPYYLGFMNALPDAMPQFAGPHPLLAAAEGVRRLADAGNLAAGLLLRILGPAGQAYLDALAAVLRKPSNQEVVNLALDAVADYFAAIRPEGRADATLAELESDAARWLAEDPDVQGVCAVVPDLAPQLRACRLLSGLGYGVLRPVLGDTTAIGSLMRRKLDPVMAPLAAQLTLLSRQMASHPDK